MNHYEVKFLVPPKQSAAQIDDEAKDCAHLHGLECNGVTVHARPSPEDGAQHDAAVFVAVPDTMNDESALHKFCGAMARKYGRPVTNYEAFGEGTLSLKADQQAVEAFKKDAHGGGQKTKETFHIGEFKDKADE